MTRIDPAPEYREQFDRPRRYEGAREEPFPRFFVAESGVVYRQEADEPILMPVLEGSARFRHLSAILGHRFDGEAPLICTCGNDAFSVHQTSWETWAACTACGGTQVVHSG